MVTLNPATLRQLRLRITIQGGRRRRRRQPRWAYPHQAERRYARALTGLVDHLQAEFLRLVFPRLEALSLEARAMKPIRQDAWPESLASILANYRITLLSSRPSRERMAQGIAEDAAEFNRAQWHRILNAVMGVDLVQQEPWIQNELKAWTQENAALITSLEGDAIKEVETWTMRGLRTGQRHEEIREKILERFEVSQSRAALIARDQVSKLNGNLTQGRQTDLGVTHYFWRVTDDDRLRETHNANRDKRFAWDSPPARTGHPGDDFQCRCNAEPDLSGLLAALGGTTR